MVDLNPINLGPKLPNPVVYNYEDIQDGSGLTTFYALVSTTSAGESYFLVNDSSMRSDPIGQKFAGITTSQTLFTAAFTVLMSSARYVEGTAMCNIPFGLNGTSAAPKLEVKWTFIHLASNGTTETILGTVTSQELSGNAINAESDGTLFIDVTGTKFARGESIRCKVELKSVITGGGTLNNIEIGHDPSNRTTGFSIISNTQIQFKIPMRIDV